MVELCYHNWLRLFISSELDSSKIEYWENALKMIKDSHTSSYSFSEYLNSIDFII